MARGWYRNMRLVKCGKWEVNVSDWSEWRAKRMMQRNMLKYVFVYDVRTMQVSKAGWCLKRIFMNVDETEELGRLKYLDDMWKEEK